MKNDKFPQSEEKWANQPDTLAMQFFGFILQIFCVNKFSDIFFTGESIERIVQLCLAFEDSKRTFHL